MQFIIEMSEMFHGSTYKQLRVFAYEMAAANIRIPQNWQENKMASIDWQKGFMARNGEGLYEHQNQHHLNEKKCF